MTDGTLDLAITPKEFFREKIASALQEENLQVSEELEFYLVNLLCSFVSPQQPKHFSPELDPLDTPLALLLKEALEAPPLKKVEIYKTLGDTSLYISGYFQDYFNRKTFDVDYYITMGSNAYGHASDLLRGDNHFRPVFRSLSGNFSRFVEVVAKVAEVLNAQGAINLLATYDRWSRTNSERLRKKLENSGIIPIPCDTKSAQ